MNNLKSLGSPMQLNIQNPVKNMDEMFHLSDKGVTSFTNWNLKI